MKKKIKNKVFEKIKLFYLDLQYLRISFIHICGGEDEF